MDVVVHQENDGAGQDPAYLQVLGHDDAVCLAYIGQTWPNGQQRGWLGDVGRGCGKRWYFSNVEVGEEKYKPGQCHHTGELEAALRKLRTYFPRGSEKEWN